MNNKLSILAIIFVSTIVPTLSGMHRAPQHPVRIRYVQPSHQQPVRPASQRVNRAHASSLSRQKTNQAVTVHTTTATTASKFTSKNNHPMTIQQTATSQFPATSYESQLQQALKESLKEYKKQQQIKTDEALAKKLQENELPTDTITTTTPVIYDKKAARIQVIHLATNQQKGLECGLRAVTNAAALENLIVNNREITPQTLQTEERLQYDQKRSWSTARENLSINDVGQFAQRIGLETLYPLGLDQKNGNVVYTIGNGETNIKTAMQTLSLLDNAPIHFVINTGGHWVVLTVVHNNNYGYRIYHIDSMNGSVGTAVTLYIDYINNMILVL